MLFDPMTGKVIEENVADPADPGVLAPNQGQHGFMPGMEPAAIRSIMRAPSKMAAPMGDDEGEVFRMKIFSKHRHQWGIICGRTVRLLLFPSHQGIAGHGSKEDTPTHSGSAIGLQQDAVAVIVVWAHAPSHINHPHLSARAGLASLHPGGWNPKAVDLMCRIEYIYI